MYNLLSASHAKAWFLWLLSWPFPLDLAPENQNFLRAPRGSSVFSIPAPARGGPISQEKWKFCSPTDFRFAHELFPNRDFAIEERRFHNGFRSPFFSDTAFRRWAGDLHRTAATGTACPSNFKQELENDWPVVFQFCLNFPGHLSSKPGQIQPTLGN